MMQEMQEKFGEQPPQGPPTTQKKMRVTLGGPRITEEDNPTEEVRKETNNPAEGMDLSGYTTESQVDVVTTKEVYEALEKLSSPASITSPPPVKDDSTPASLDSQKANQENLARTNLIEFVGGDTFSVAWCAQRINSIVQGSSFVPTPNLWRTPPGTDLSRVVYDVVVSEGWVERRWPSLRMVMGQSIDNVEWSCGVLCWFALMDAIMFLGPVRQAFDDMNRD
jgi:hypothetical protein